MKRIVNLYGGPGTGKSTTATALFAELKYRGVNCEYIPEYAKDATWEGRGEKFFRAQEYIFAKQHFRISRTIDDVELIVTDSPLLLSLVYSKNFALSSFQDLVVQTYNTYENIDIMLTRAPFSIKAYNPKGRNQTPDEAIHLDTEIRSVLVLEAPDFVEIPFSRRAVSSIIGIMNEKGWNIPWDVSDDDPK